MKRSALLVLLWSLLTLLSAQLLVEGFENNWPPEGWLLHNAGSGNIWEQQTSYTGCSEGTHCMIYRYSSTQAANAWAFSAGIPMVAGRNYRVEFDQKVQSSGYPEQLRVTLGTAQTVASQTYTMLDYSSPGLTNMDYITRVSSEYLCLESGTYYMGFNCYSRRDMFVLYIDNILLYETIPNAAPDFANCVYPANASTSIMPDPILAWSAISGNVDGYYLSLGTNNPPSNVISNHQLIIPICATPQLQYDTVYYWQAIPFNEFGITQNCPVWSFTTGSDPTVSSFPYTESFDISLPPYGWHSNPEEGTWNWLHKPITTTYPQLPPHSGAGMACYDINGSSEDDSAILVSPPILADPATYIYSLSLWMIRELVLPGYPDRINIYYSTQPDMNNAPILLQTFHRSVYLEPSGEQIAGWHEILQGGLPFSAGNQNYIIIEAVNGNGGSIYVDDLTISRAPMPQVPLACVSPSPLPNSLNQPVNTNLSWEPGDEITDGYRLYLGTNNPPSNMINALDLAALQSYTPALPFSYDTVYYWKVVPYNEIGSSLNCPVWSFTTGSLPAVSVYPYEVDFSTYLPSGWSMAGVGTNNWSQSFSLSAGGTSPEAKLSWSPQFTGINRLQTAILNTSGISALQLNFLTYYDHYNGAFEIGVATRHGAGEWTVVWSHTSSTLPAGQISLLLQNSDIGQPDTQVCFYASGDSYNMNFWYLDNISFTNAGVGTPQNLTISATEAGLLLTWDEVAEASGYTVWQSSSPFLAFDPIAQVNWHKVNLVPVMAASLLIDSFDAKAFYRVTAIR